MRRFFRGRSFRVMVIIVAIVTALSITVGVIKIQAPQSSVIGTLMIPFQSLIKSVDGAIDGYFDTFTEYDELKKENEKLREQITQLEKEKIEWQEDVAQNEFYKQFYDIQEDNPDYKFTSAKVVSRDTTDAYGSFTVNVGNLDGVSRHDPVITSEGLVGYVSVAYPTYSVVTTLLSPDLKVGVNNSRTGETGIVSGSAEVALDGMTRMNDISRLSGLAEGDHIVTSGGGGVFPKGLVIGTVKKIGQVKNQTIMYADIDPAADVLGCTNVMVIVSFTGQNQ